MRLILTALMLVFSADAASAQQIRFDSVSGDYFAMVFNDALEQVEMRIVPADKVAVTVTVDVEQTDGVLRYAYAITESPSSPQDLSTYRVPCPNAADDFANLVAVAAPDVRERWISRASGAWCSFVGGALPLTPGATLDVRFETSRLPEIGRTRVVGARAGLQGPWPTSDPIPENDPIRAFIDTIDGIFAGWKEVTSLVPTRDPSLFADPAAGIGLIQNDLAEACGALAWITSTTVCSRLSSSLAEALAAPDVARRRSALTDFLVELDAQHDPARGLPVTDNAFHLLSVNARHLRDAG